MLDVAISPLGGNVVANLDQMVRESELEGFLFLRRLRDEYTGGANRFDLPGELLLGAYRSSLLVGVGGVNVDPYSGDPRTGRVRHVYVLRFARRQGVGRALVQALIDKADAYFDQLVLHTDSASAACFYEALGFTRESSPTFTHRRALG